MPRPTMRTLSSDGHILTTLHGLQHLWEEQILCDARLHAKGGAVLLAHKVMLMSCSGYFYNYFSCKQEEEKTPDTAYLDEATSETISIILHFIYTGNLKLSSATVKNVLRISEFLEIQDAKDLCAEFADQGKRLSSKRITPGELDDSDDENQLEGATLSDNLSTSATRNLPSGEESSLSRRSRRSKNVHLYEEEKLREIVTTEEDIVTPLELGEKHRKPNRSQKLTDQVVASKSSTKEENVQVSSRTKRKCARPKKLDDYKVTSVEQQNVDTCSNNVDEEATCTPKRGRGRPRKSVGVAGGTGTPTQPVKFTQEVSSSTEVIKKRGRPKGSKGKKSRVKVDAEIDVFSGNVIVEAAAIKSPIVEEREEVEEDKDESFTTLRESPSTRQSSRKRKCRRCAMEFETARSLERHRVQCRKNIQFDKPNKYKRKKCGKCKVEFPDFESYEEHRKLHRDKSASRTTEKSHLCEFCDSTFRYDNFLACHQYSKHRIPFDESKYTVLRCSTCDYVTINKWRFKVHMEQHDNQRPHVCDICGKSFKASSSLASHKHTHSQQRNFECPECGKKFMQQNGREQHIRRIHKKEMSFLCHLCPYKCFVKSELLQHLFKDHHVPLPKKYVRYKCEICDFMTFRRFHYLNHMNMHEGKRIFECEVCHKKYTSKVVLRCHMQFHKEPRHKCTWEGCNYAAVQRRRLEQHIRLIHTHKDDKPFTCHICSYRTALNGNLKLHLRNVHHLDIPRRQLLKRKTDTPGASEKDLTAGTIPMGETVLTSMDGENMVTFAVTNCQDVSSITAAGGDNDGKNTVVYTILQSSDLPSQVTAAQVLQQLSTGGSSPSDHHQPHTLETDVDPGTLIQHSEGVLHLTMSMNESDKHTDNIVSDVGGQGGDRIVRVTRGRLIQELTTRELGSEIHIPVGQELGTTIHVLDRDMTEDGSQSHLLAMSGEMLSREIHIQRDDSGGMGREIHIQREDSGGMGREINLQRDDSGGMNREIHIQRDVSGGMDRELHLQRDVSDVLDRQIHIQREDAMGREMPREYQPVREMSVDMVRDVNRDLLLQSRDLPHDLQREMGRESGIVIREIMNAQFPPESYLQDGRNINMITQPMENREAYPPPPQGSYWTQY